MNSGMLGNNNQLIKARRISFRDGVSDGVKAIELHNQSGLYATFIEDQCLNIYDFSYKGINCAFQSKNGLVSNKFFNGGANEFSYYWPAGMLYTCGLTNVGPGVMENGIYHTEHGRIGMCPAENTTLVKGEESIVITGSMRDSFLAGHHLQLERKITFPNKGKEIEICDCVTNKEPMDTEMMILYHFNFGYPLLAPGARIVKGVGEIYDNIGSGTDPEHIGNVTAPQNNKIEEVYCHTNVPDAFGYGYAAVINDELKLGCYIKYKMDTLPLLVQWKSMCTNDYCIGLEPSNSFIMGRIAERKHGTLKTLRPYESQSFTVALGVLDGADDIANFEKMLENL